MFAEVDANVCWQHDDSDAADARDAAGKTAAAIVQTVRPESEAHELGVRPGMLLYSIGDHLVAGSATAEALDDDAVHETVAGFDAALLLIRKFGRPVTLRFIVTEL